MAAVFQLCPVLMDQIPVLYIKISSDNPLYPLHFSLDVDPVQVPDSLALCTD